MNHLDHVSLLKEADIKPGTVWADFGSGEGAFTLALRDIAGPNSEIYSIDKDAKSLEKQKRAFDAQFPGSNIHYMTKNFTEEIVLPELDGIIMANSLHYVRDKKSLLVTLLSHLREGGSFILVEYNVDKGNFWVPFPISFKSFQKLAASTDLAEPKLLGKIPSTFLKEIYSSITYKK